MAVTECEFSKVISPTASAQVHVLPLRAGEARTEKSGEADTAFEVENQWENPWRNRKTIKHVRKIHREM